MGFGVLVFEFRAFGFKGLILVMQRLGAWGLGRLSINRSVTPRQPTRPPKAQSQSQLHVRMPEGNSDSKQLQSRKTDDLPRGSIVVPFWGYLIGF